MTASLRSPRVALLAAVVATLVVLLESTRVVPWAPFFIVYAALAIVVPLRARTFELGPFKATFRQHGLFIAAIFVACLVWDLGVMEALWNGVVERLGLDPQQYTLDVAVENLLQSAAGRLGLSKDAAFGLFAFFVLLWAPVGEELFYRGYLFPVWRPSGAWRAAVAASLFFAVRHATHFALVWPNVPWGAALQWSVSTLGIGLLLTWLYARTGALWTVMVVHFLINVVEVAAG